MSNKKPKPGFVNKNNMALLTDLYQLTMDASYHHHNKNTPTTFYMFVRKLPKNRNYLISGGLEQLIHYLENLTFNEETISYLREQNLFREEFLQYLKNFKFSCDVYAMPEGTIAFEKEPIIIVHGPKIEAQLIETYLLNQINTQTMLASKASRIVETAKPNKVVDFSLRRTHGSDAGMKIARASYIAGCEATSNVLAGKEFDIPINGTMAHSYIMSFETELESFRAYAETFPNSTTLLIDTYDTVQGAKNAAIVGKELEKKGHKLRGVRLDSGDLADLSKKVRKILNQEGLNYVKIFASNDLNEYKILELKEKNAPIDAYGVGTEMGTSKDAPAISGVYKLCQYTNNEGNLESRIKLSKDKITLPGKMQVYRQTNKEGKYTKDVITKEGEKIEGKPLLIQVMEKGKTIYKQPSLKKIREHCQQEIKKLPAEYKNINQTTKYEVELSKELQELTQKLIKKEKGRK